MPGRGRSSRQDPRPAWVHLGPPTLGDPYRAVRFSQHARADGRLAIEERKRHVRRGTPRRRPQRHDLDLGSRPAIAIAPFVLRLEVLDRRDHDLVTLAGIATVHTALGLDIDIHT